MTPTLTFVCSICGEPSVSICVHCTKDACPNHVCDRCGRCSDCCECDIRLEEHSEIPALQEMEEVPVQSLEDQPLESPDELPKAGEAAPPDSATVASEEPEPLSAEQWTGPEATIPQTAPVQPEDAAAPDPREKSDESV